MILLPQGHLLLIINPAHLKTAILSMEKFIWWCEKQSKATQEFTFDFLRWVFLSTKKEASDRNWGVTDAHFSFVHTVRTHIYERNWPDDISTLIRDTFLPTLGCAYRQQLKDKEGEERKKKKETVKAKEAKRYTNITFTLWSSVIQQIQSSKVSVVQILQQNIFFLTAYFYVPCVWHNKGQIGCKKEENTCMLFLGSSTPRSERMFEQRTMTEPKKRPRKILSIS